MKVYDDEYYFKLQLNLESLDVKDNKLIKIRTKTFDVEKTKSIPKVVIVKFDDQIKRFYSSKLSDKLVVQLESISSKTFFGMQKQITKILDNNRQYKQCNHYVSYIFPNYKVVDRKNTKIFYNNADELIKKFGKSFYKKYPIMYTIIQNKEIASCCVSSRENNVAGEAWIFTLSQYRKQGFGSQAVKLWTHSMQCKHKIPFYSHEISNESSKKLASKLNLIKVFEIINYD